MADHSKPTTASAYANFTSELDARFDDLTLGLDPAYVTPTNLPTNAIRFSSAAAKWQRWNGTSWVDPVAGNTYAISISGNSGTVTNGVYTSGTYADPAWITSIAGTKVTGNISGNAGSATVLQTARTINGVSFNGSANINVNLNNALSFATDGSGAASGATFNGSAARTISYNSVGAPSVSGANATGTWAISISGNAATATTALSADNATNATNAATAVTVSDSAITTAKLGNGAVTSAKMATGAAVGNLGFTPVQQGGGGGQGTNKLYMGWSGSGLRFQVDATDFGLDWPMRSTNGAKAWVNFDSGGGVRAAFSVTSVTKLDVGRFYVNFSYSLPDSSYAVVAGGGDASSFGFESGHPFPYACYVAIHNTFNGEYRDTASCMVSVFR